jgi:hypothetical protein
LIGSDGVGRRWALECQILPRTTARLVSIESGSQPSDGEHKVELQEDVKTNKYSSFNEPLVIQRHSRDGKHSFTTPEKLFNGITAHLRKGSLAGIEDCLDDDDSSNDESPRTASSDGTVGMDRLVTSRLSRSFV